MLYQDPLNPQVDANDYIRAQTQRVGTDTVTWASGTASAPSKPRSRFTLPKVGLASRLFVDIDGGSATAYDLTIGAGTAAAPADGRGPYSIVDGFTLRVNGGSGWYDVSGFGTYLVNASDDVGAFPQGVPGTAYATAPRNVAGTIFAYDATADSRPRFGFEIPIALAADQPLGMILLQNDQTTVELEVRWAALDSFAALAAGAVATLTLTATVVMEYYDVPPRDAFTTFFLPLLRWAHWWVEERQDVTAKGRDANIVTLDNHDTYLRIIHTLILNSVVDTDHVEALRFVLNRQTTLYDHTSPVHLRIQRNKIAKDLPAYLWDFFSVGNLRDVIHADSYTDIRSVLDVATSGTVAAGDTLRTAVEKLVDLGSPPAAATV